MTKRVNENLSDDVKSKDCTSEKGTEMGECSLLELIVSEDRKWTSFLSVCAHEESHLPRIRPLMKAFEISFHGLLWLSGTVIAFFLTHRRQDIELLVNLFLLLILDLVVVGLGKLLFRRPRPAHNKMDMFGTVSVDLFSFPSGHATRAAMVGCFLVDKVAPPAFSPFILAFCGCVGLSRILLGRHHVLDVFFGFVIGVLEYLVYLPFWLPFLVIEEWLHDFLSHTHM